MPRYFTFIRAAENQGAPPKALMDAMEKFIGESLQNGSLVSTGGLKLSPHGVRIRVGKGKLTMTDGPFAESKEVIGGYAILEAPTKAKVPVRRPAADELSSVSAAISSCAALATKAESAGS